MIRESILDTIGRTPMVKINRMNTNKKVMLLAKIESFNPGGSLKDRIAQSIISKAEEDGTLTKEKVILESTSGNMGVSLAMVAAVKGYNVTVTLLETASAEKKRILEAYGVTVISVDKKRGPDGARDEALRLYKENTKKYFLVGQNMNSNNIQAHYETTGNEIWEDTKEQVDCFVAGIGTSGTIVGVGKKLKELKPEVTVIGVEPFKNHNVFGLKNLEESRLPEIYDDRWIDKTVQVSDEEAVKATQELIKKEGIFAGISSGAAMAVALKEAKELEKGCIVVLFADGGERYLSTGILTKKK